MLRKQYQGVRLELPQVRELIQQRFLRKPVTLSGKGNMVLVMSDQGQVMDIQVPSPQQQRSMAVNGSKQRPRQSVRKPARAKDEKALGSCPLCGRLMTASKRSFSCSGWKQGCEFAIWKTIAGKRISVRTAQTLLSKGKTSILKGFKSKAGKSFDASLTIDNGQVRFEFGRS